MNSNTDEASLINEARHLVFGWIDYTLFGSLLGLSLLIGIYYGFFSKQNSTSEYLFGGKSMNYVPVAASILASFLSGITFLGIPTEVYNNGSQYYAVVFAALIICLISINVTMPVFHELQVSSCFEYLELRFSKSAKTFASVLYIATLILYVPIVVYVPALAFSQVTGYSVHAIAPVFSIICITYTSLGGVKAVVYTDTLQFAFTICGLVSVLILSIISVGGFGEVWRIAERGGRLKFFDMDPSPFRRDTFWAMTIGMTFTMLNWFGLGQKFVQRFLALKNKSDMNKAIILSTFGWGVLQLVCVLTGLVMYAKYYNCDPLMAKLISRSDQTLPYFVMDIAGHVSGLPGVFLAGLVSSALSTMSASLNTLSATIYDTFIDRWIKEGPGKDAKAATIMKVVSASVGVVSIGLIFVVERLGTVFEVALSITSAMEGALLGLFLMALLVPWVGRTGALAGATATLLAMGCFVAGVQWHTLNRRIRYPGLPHSVDGCPAGAARDDVLIDYGAIASARTTTTPQPQLEEAEERPMALFHVAVVYFTFVGSVLAVAVGLVASYVAGEADLTKVDPRHVSPIVRRLLPKKKFYVGVPMNDFQVDKTNGTKREENLICH